MRTVKITKINKIIAGDKEHEPGEEITVTPGEKITLNVHIYNDGWLPAEPKDVFVGTSPRGTNQWQETVVGDTGYLWPKDDEDQDFQYTIPKNLSAGWYSLGVRTEEMDYYLATEIYVEEPIPSGMGRIEIQSTPPRAKAYLDGELLEDLTPVALDVEPGEHYVSVEKEGYKVKKISGADKVLDNTAVVKVLIGQRKVVTFELEPTAALWKSAWFWGLAGLGVGAVLAVKKKPEYVRKAKEVVKPYAERAREVVKPYAERVIGAVRR